MSLKVLRLENWMLFKYGETPEDYIKYGTIKEIDPILNRPGYYRKDGITWFENNGKSYEILNDKMFEYTLSLFPYRVLRDCEIEVIKLLLKYKLPIHSRLYKDYRIYSHLKYARNIHIDMNKRLLSYRKTKVNK